MTGNSPPATKSAVPEGYSDEQLEAGVEALRYMYSKLGEYLSDEKLCGCIYDAMIAKRAPSETASSERDAVIEEVAKHIEASPMTYFGPDPGGLRDLRYLIVAAIRGLKGRP